jgi:hypothetical protein
MSATATPRLIIGEFEAPDALAVELHGRAQAWFSAERAGRAAWLQLVDAEDQAPVFQSGTPARPANVLRLVR